MTRRKVVLMIVEGPTDQVALGSVLSKLFDPKKILVKVLHGDITSAYENNPATIIGKYRRLFSLSHGRVN